MIPHEYDDMPARSMRKIGDMRPIKPLLHGDITGSIIDSFREAHEELGFGFREYIYARALERLLIAKGHKVRREVPVTVYFRGDPLASERMDMLVDDVVVVENNTREMLDPDANGQLFAALAATDLEVGLILHFGKQARFYRVFFENRFKQRNKRARADQERRATEVL